MKRIEIFCLLFLVLFIMPLYACAKHVFGVGNRTFLLDGRSFVVKAAELHYPRIPRPYWEHRIRMCKALGMNTVCLYVFWNVHEQREGEFDFTGQNDVAEFCRIAQKNGMYVIVRPGPYVCAEWEMGGLPWWLLKKKDIRLREQDTYFMERVRLFEQKVGEQLFPLTIGQGGSIIMVQVENEYGSYGTDKAYVSAIRDIVKEAFSGGGECVKDEVGDDIGMKDGNVGKSASGSSVPVFFQCDWASNFENNGLDDLVWTMNFGTGANIDEQFRRLGEIRPDAPLMCSEFWSGWFDKWGARHETRPAEDMVAGIDEMLSKGISFSLYMTHGGTSFGHWAGANSPGFAPDVTSYDYDAPINEYGLATPKYHELRKVMAKYAVDGRLPDIPKSAAPLISIPELTLSEFAPLECGICRTVESHSIKSMEELDMGWGTMIYETGLPVLSEPSLLTVSDVHDYARVFVNGDYVGKIDRVKNEKTLVLPAVAEGSRLTMIVEAVGRINFGRAIKDFKGITDRVTITTEAGGHTLTYDLKNWTISTLPDDYDTALRAFSTISESSFSGAGYYRGYFSLNKTGDTFINMEAFGKGQVYVNGHAIGRYWNIGPQQTLYMPGCWLKKGLNEIIVLDVVGPAGNGPVVSGQPEPELDKLEICEHLVHDDLSARPDLADVIPAVTGKFVRGNGWQSVKFASPLRGRHIALDIRSVYGGGNVAAVAEIYAVGTDGNRLGREQWTVKYADSEDVGNGNMTGDKVYDLQESTFWQTAEDASLPHLLVIDLGSDQTVAGIEYLPRAEQDAPGCIEDYAVYVF